MDYHLFLCKGSYTILTKNIWKIAGLCNGATGHVVYIIYSDVKTPSGLPDCLIVYFGDKYSGQLLFGNDKDCNGWDSISPDNYERKTSSIDSHHGTETSTHNMIPLRLCYDYKI